MEDNADRRLCKDCKHCLRIPDVGGYFQYCENPLTKMFSPPVGFLDQRAKACEHFEPSTKKVIAALLREEVFA
jgi:hypothetical protein